MKSLSSRKGGSSGRSRASRTSLGRKLPAHSALDFSDRGPPQAYIQDPESGIPMFTANPPTTEKRVTKLQELGYDLNRVAFLDNEKKINISESPSSPPLSMPPPLRPPRTSFHSVRSGQSQRSLVPHEFPVGLDPPLDRAYIKRGRVVIKRTPDSLPEESSTERDSLVQRHD